MSIVHVLSGDRIINDVYTINDVRSACRFNGLAGIRGITETGIVIMPRL